MSRQCRPPVLLLCLSLSGAPLLAADLTRVYEIYELKSPQAALSFLDRMSLDPSQQFEGQLLRGVLLAKMGRAAEAEKLFQQLNGQHPDQPEPLHNLAILDARRGKRAAAILALEEILSVYPTYDAARTNLERIQASAPDSDDAISTTQEPLFLTAKPGRYRRVDPSAAARESLSNPSSELAHSPESQRTDTPPPAEVPREELKRVVAAWAEAWSQQRIREFFLHYASDFRPADGSAREVWESRRRQEVAAPRLIEVEIDFDTLEVWAVGPGEMGVRFIQTYRADRSSDTVRKTLGLVREKGGWKIVSETSQ